jgi:hypothetical protein
MKSGGRFSAEATMDARLIVLRRFLEALGEDDTINGFDQRKRLQKAVYMGQLSGVDLGYRYGWYIKGPYSTDLTRDYYALAQAIDAGEQVPPDKQLKPEVRTRLQTLGRLFSVPDGIPLSRTDWLELIASWHYLLKVSRLHSDRARKLMQDQKPALASYVANANQALSAAGVLS